MKNFKKFNARRKWKVSSDTYAEFLSVTGSSTEMRQRRDTENIHVKLHTLLFVLAANNAA